MNSPLKRKTLSILLTLAMLISMLLPAAAWAAVDKTALTAAINVEYSDGAARTTNALTQADYTAASWTAYTVAITAAITVEADANATQVAVDAAAAAIGTAKAALVFAGAADLVTAKAAAAALVQANYTAASWAGLVTALALSETTNAEVVTKTTAINAAIAALVLAAGGGGGVQPPGGGATVTGSITTPNGNESLDNTRIFFINMANMMQSPFVTIDAETRTYQASGVQPGNYRISVVSPAGLFLTGESTFTVSQGTSNLTLDISLSAGTTVTGRITGVKAGAESAVGLENVYVTLFDKLPVTGVGQPNPADIPGIYQGTTNNGGAFTINVPSDGLYYLTTMNPHGLMDKTLPPNAVTYGGTGIQVVLAGAASGQPDVRTAEGGSIGDIVLESTAAVGGSISLTAVRNGAGVAEARVAVGNPGTMFFKESSTGQDGSATVSGIPAGSGYAVTVTHADSQGNILSGAVRNINVNAESDTALGQIELRAPNELPPGGQGIIEGTVRLFVTPTGTGGQHPPHYEMAPVPGVTVFLYNGSLMYGASTITDENGAYEFTGLPDSENYLLSVWSPQGFTNPADPEGRGVPVTIDENNREVTQDFCLGGTATSRGSGISGTVTDGGTGSAVEGITVSAVGAKGGGVGITDRQGRYTIEGLSSDSYTVTARGNGTDYEDGVLQNIQVTKGGITPNVNFSLKLVVVDRGRISGFVKNVAGQGLSGVEVSAWSLGKMSWSNTTTDFQGFYTLDRLKTSDDYEVSFVWQTGGQYLYETQRNVRVEKDRTTTVNQTMDTGIAVRGKVINSQGSGVGDVQITASENNGSHYAWAVTDAGGNYSLLQMKSNKTYNLTFYVNPVLGYILPANVPSSVNVGTSDAIMSDITLVSGLQFDGFVVHKTTNTGISGIDVFAHSSSTGSWSRTRSGNDGQFTLKGLAPADDYVISTHDKSRIYENTETTGKKLPDDQNLGNIELLKPSEKTGNFTGEGNSLRVSDLVTAPGRVLTYRINYRNNGGATVTGAAVTAMIPGGTTYVNDSAAINSNVVTPGIAGGNITFSIPSVIRSGESGTITYQVRVESDTTATTFKNSASISAGGVSTPLGSATTELAYATISGPSVTRDGKLTVYGNCSAGSTVIIEATKSEEASARRVGRAASSGRWWSQEIDLGSAEDTYHVTARVEMADGSVSNASSPLETRVKSDSVTISSIKVNSGWNKNVTINPALGIVTLAIVENSPIDIEVSFSGAVSDVKTHFIGRTSSLTEGTGNTWSGGVISGSWSSAGDQLIEVEYTAGGSTIRTPIVNVIILIDPSGFVYDGTYGTYDRFSPTIESDTAGKRLSGVTALCEVNSKADGSGTWSKWNAAAYGQVNPQITDDQGRYGWDVPAGTYRVIFSKPGYQTVFSDAIVGVTVIPPPELKLHVGLISVAPQVVDRTPPVSTTGVAVNSTVSVKFSKNIDPATLTNNFTLRKGNDLVAGTVAYNSNTKTATFTPGQQLSHGTTYEVNISSNVADGEGNRLPTAVSWSFTTAPAPASGGGGGGGTATTDAVEKAITDSTGKNTVAINYGGKVDAALTAANLSALNNTGKPAAVQLQNATFTLPPGTLDVPAAAGAESIQMSAAKLDKVGSQVAFSRAANAGQFMLAGEVFELGVTAVMLNGSKIAVREFAKPIQVTLPVPADQREAAARGDIKVYRLNEATNTWEEKGGVYDAGSGTITFTTSQFSKFALLAAKGGQASKFTDIAGHWARAQIELMAANGYVKGMGGGLFAPDASVTRAQFATLLANVLNLAGDAGAPFTDVQPGQWYYATVGRAYAAGLVRGMSATLFAPDDLITREQMAAMICNALGYKGILVDVEDMKARLAGFADKSSISGWARKSAAQAVAHGIIKGKPFGGAVNFAPSDRATRAEAVVMLKNLLDQLK